MPLKKYCPSCGKATEYTSVAPKLCCQCGTNFTQAFGNVTAPKLAKKVIARKIEEYEEEDDDNFEDEDVKEKNDFSGFEADVEIEGNSGVNKTTFGALINQPKIEGFKARPADKTIPKSQKAFDKWLLEQSQTKKIVIGGESGE